VGRRTRLYLEDGAGNGLDANYDLGYLFASLSVLREVGLITIWDVGYDLEFRIYTLMTVRVMGWTLASSVRRGN
jgi:hypothetical protein